MSALSEMVGTHAPPHTFEHEGKTYSLRMIDDALKVAWERKLMEKDKEFLRECKGMLSQREFLDALNKINEKYMTGYYGLLSHYGLKLMKSREGGLILGALIFDCDQTTMMKLMAARPTEVGSLISLIIRESLPVVELSEEQREAKKASRLAAGQATEDADETAFVPDPNF